MGLMWDGWTRQALRTIRTDELNVVFFVGVLEKRTQPPKFLSLCHPACNSIHTNNSFGSLGAPGREPVPLGG